MKKEKTIKASSIKTREHWQKAMESGVRIVFDDGSPMKPSKKGK